MIPNPTPKQELFHYCPTESFFGIISSQALWLSNSEHANDPNENRIALDILTDIAKDSDNRSARHFAKSVLEYEFPPVDDVSSYVFCLSENEDDLNQWREYADYGYGL
jgi:hypothetical protein